jgi:putative ABC transport system permease protein
MTAPLTTPAISLGNLYARPFRSLCLVILIAVLSFTLVGGSLVASSLVKGVDSMSKRLGADLLIVPSGYDRAIEGILLRSESGSFYMDDDWVNKIAALEGVRTASPQLFITSLSASCCTLPVQLVGFDRGTDFVIGPWVNTVFGGGLTDEEIIIGSAISGQVGATLRFFNRDYRVAARLDRTGMGFDSSVFMNMSSAKRAAEDCILAGGQIPPLDKCVSSILVSVDPGYTPRNVYDAIQKTFDYGNSGVVPVLSKKIINTVVDGLHGLIGFIVIMIVVLWALAISVLIILFCVTLGERTQEFGVYRALGASRKKLVNLILCESALISLAGSVGGMVFSLIIILPFGALIGEITQMPYILPSIGRFVLIMGMSLLLSFIAGPLASLYPALKIGGMDVYAVIRRNGL